MTAEVATRLPVELDLDEDQRLLRESTRGFLERHFPLSEVRDGLGAAQRELDRERWRAACEQGWIAVLVDEPNGGLAPAPGELAVIAEDLGRHVNGAPFLGCALAAAALAGAPTGSPAGELAARLAQGDAVAAWAGPEPLGADWGLEAIATQAVADGADVRLTGEKSLVPDADLADQLVVVARADDELAQFVVPADALGVSIRTAASIDLTRRFCTVELDDVRVPESARVSDAAGPGYPLALAGMLVSLDGVGAAERLMEMTVEYAKERIAFGRPIASYQAVKHKCADMLLGVEAARAAARYALLALVGGRRDAANAVAVAKSYAAEACSAIAGESLQIHGGIGFTWEHDLHMFLRRVKADEELFGGARWHRDGLANLILGA